MSLVVQLFSNVKFFDPNETLHENILLYVQFKTNSYFGRCFTKINRYILLYYISTWKCLFFRVKYRCFQRHILLHVENNMNLIEEFFCIYYQGYHLYKI